MLTLKRPLTRVKDVALMVYDGQLADSVTETGLLPALVMTLLTGEIMATYTTVGTPMGVTVPTPPVVSDSPSVPDGI